MTININQIQKLEIRYQIIDLSELDYKLIRNALKVWRGDFNNEIHITEIWKKEVTSLLERIGEICLKE